MSNDHRTGAGAEANPPPEPPTEASAATEGWSPAPDPKDATAPWEGRDVESALPAPRKAGAAGGGEKPGRRRKGQLPAQDSPSLKWRQRRVARWRRACIALTLLTIVGWGGFGLYSFGKELMQESDSRPILLPLFIPMVILTPLLSIGLFSRRTWQRFLSIGAAALTAAIATVTYGFVLVQLWRFRSYPIGSSDFFSFLFLFAADACAVAATLWLARYLSQNPGHLPVALATEGPWAHAKSGAENTASVAAGPAAQFRGALTPRRRNIFRALAVVWPAVAAGFYIYTVYQAATSGWRGSGFGIQEFVLIGVALLMCGYLIASLWLPIPWMRFHGLGMNAVGSTLTASLLLSQIFRWIQIKNLAWYAPSSITTFGLPDPNLILFFCWLSFLCLLFLWTASVCVRLLRHEVGLHQLQLEAGGRIPAVAAPVAEEELAVDGDWDAGKPTQG